MWAYSEVTRIFSPIYSGRPQKFFPLFPPLPPPQKNFHIMFVFNTVYSKIPYSITSWAQKSWVASNKINKNYPQSPTSNLLENQNIYKYCTAVKTSKIFKLKAYYRYFVAKIYNFYQLYFYVTRLSFSCKFIAIEQ